jgi:DNA uptake protein ComE-like DNA-binding protein
MMLRPSIIRSVILLSTLLCVLSMAACASGGNNAQTNSANSATSNTAGTTNAPAATATPASTATTNQTGGDTAPGSATAKAKLNLNTATGEEFLAAIPGLGKRMVHEFEEYRPYRSVQQFRREMGKYVSAEQIAGYEKYVYVPIAENEADAATLQQIPGLDAAEAEALIAGRPYASRDAFLTKLAEKVSAEDVAVARAYLNSR